MSHSAVEGNWGFHLLDDALLVVDHVDALEHLAILATAHATHHLIVLLVPMSPSERGFWQALPPLLPRIPPGHVERLIVPVLLGSMLVAVSVHAADALGCAKLGPALVDGRSAPDTHGSLGCQ